MSACSPADAPVTDSGAPVPTSISVQEDLATESAPADPSPTPAPIPYGIYAMMDWQRIAGADGGKAAPWVKAGHYAFTWRQVNPAPGEFDWHLMDMWLTAEAGPRESPTGKRAALGINAYEGGAGDAAPEWVLERFGMRGYDNTACAVVAAGEHPQPDLRPLLIVEAQLPGENGRQQYLFPSGRVGDHAIADTWIEAQESNRNHAQDAQLVIGRAGQANALLGFHLTDIPLEASIISATLRLHVVETGCGGSLPLEIAAYALRRPWMPAEVTWQSPRAGEAWTIRGANGVLADADRSAEPAGLATILTAGMVEVPLEPALVQAWLQEPAANDGLLVKQMPAGPWLPRYWEEGYLEALSQMVHALAERYAGDPRLAWVEISVGIYGETAPANDPLLKWAYAEAGLTSEIDEPARGLYSWVSIVRRIIDIYRNAFPDTPLFLQYSNNFESVSERAGYVPYAVERGIGLKHNGLYPDSIDGATYGGPAVGTYNIMFTYSETIPVGWEFQVFPRTKANVYWALLNALDKHADFVMVQKDAVALPELVPMYEFANQYLGATLETTPGVWVALRETERPAERWHTQMGNFSFWLYQRDGAPDGLSVSLWKVTEEKEGLFARRTDQASGSRYLYFDIDDRYLQGYAGPLAVEVTYLDRGDDQWHLEYDAGTAAPARTAPVRKGNSGTWKRQRFVLTDAIMRNGLAGMDFRIDCEGDGDEIIHWVQVSKRVP